MFKKGQFIIAVVFIISFLQCRKVDIVPDVQGTPQFFVTLNTDTATLNFTAGVDDYALLTAYEQSADGVYTFIGEFKKETNQTANEPSLRFEIRDRAANSSQVSINEALALSNYLFFKIDSSSLEIDSSFIANFTLFNATDDCLLNLLPTDFHWDFGDGQDAFGVMQSHVYENGDNRTVKLSVDIGANEPAIFEQMILFDSNALPLSLEIQDTLLFVQNDLFIELFAVANGGLSPYAYLWQDNSMSSSYEALLLDSMSTLYSVIVTDSEGHTITASGNIPRSSNFSDLCTPSFFYETMINRDTSFVGNNQFSAVTVIYVDENGNEYRSDQQTQNSAFFTIQNVENFADNENGEKTKKMNVDFSCELFSIEGLPSINVFSNNGAIGIAYPD